MTNQTIHIGPGTDINLQSLVASRMMIQGVSGSGKSGLVRKIIEEAFGKIPFVVWDVEGEYYTLKELASDIIVIGGQYADISLTMELAEKLPDFIVKNRLSVVVDISDLKIGRRIAFTTDFFQALMEIPLKFCTPYLFFLEECHTLAGEQEKQDSTSAIKELMSRGRKRGFCGIPITQRIAMLNKSVAAQCNNKFIGKTVLDTDIERSRKELGFKKASDGMKLNSLELAHFYAYGSSISPQYVHEVIVDKPTTSMVEAGTYINFKPKKLTADLLDKLSKLSEIKEEETENATYEESDAVKELEFQLSQTKKLVFDQQNEIIALQTKYEKWHDALKYADKMIHGFLHRLEQNIKDFKEEYSPELKKELSDNFTPISTDVPKIENYSSKEAITSGNGEHVEKVLTVINNHRASGDNSLSGGERLILIACAQYKNGLLRKQLTILAGYKQSARNTYISRLKQKGYLQQEGDQVQATTEGKKALGKDYQPLPTGKKLQEYWLNRLTGGEKAIFQVLLSHYPLKVSRDFISKKTDYKQSARDTYISRLNGRELITIPSRGEVRASDFLFDN